MKMETEDTIDLLHLAKVLWKHAIAIVLAGLIFGAAAFIGTKVFITPMYDARALMYVNSTNLSLGGSKVSISTAEISAAKSLVDTYSVILKTRMTLEDVIEQSGVGYTYEQLAGCREQSVRHLLQQVDVLVDGPYLEAQRDLTLSFRGSGNQRLIDVPASLKSGGVVLYQPEG